MTQFADKLRELREKATASIEDNVDLKFYLANHSAEIEALVRAAEDMMNSPDEDSDANAYFKLSAALAALNNEMP